MSRAARAMHVAAVGCACIAAGCAAQSKLAVPAQTAAIRSTQDLAGVWVEYWAPAGKADSQRFAFLLDGRFAWQAALSGQPPAAGPARKAGHFQVERFDHDHAGTLVLSVASDEQRTCAPCAEGSADIRRVDYAPERLERYELGECAPNVEAQAQDASYACLAIAGRAFWRQSTSQADAQALLWPQTPPQ